MPLPIGLAWLHFHQLYIPAKRNNLHMSASCILYFEAKILQLSQILFPWWAQHMHWVVAQAALPAQAAGVCATWRTFWSQVEINGILQIPAQAAPQEGTVGTGTCCRGTQASKAKGEAWNQMNPVENWHFIQVWYLLQGLNLLLQEMQNTKAMQYLQARFLEESCFFHHKKWWKHIPLFLWKRFHSNIILCTCVRLHKLQRRNTKVLEEK